MIPDRGWSLEQQGDSLVVHAGADLRYALADVTPPVAAEVLAAWQSGSFDRSALSASAVEVFDQLATAGALRPLTAMPGAPAVETVFAGDAVPAIESSVRSVSASGFSVVARTTATLADLVAVAAGAAGTGPYLVVDVAYHHTISLGPFVVPGQTACAGCLAGRLASRWGDAPPPSRPSAAYAPVTAAVIAHEVAKGRQAGLVNRTVALDLDRWRTVESAVLRLPWCAVCGAGDDGRPASGRIELPWAPPEP